MKTCPACGLELGGGDEAEAIRNVLTHARNAHPEAQGLKLHPDFGDLITLEDFADMSRTKALTDEDGSGYFATKDWLSDIPAVPSVFLHCFPIRHPGQFTHVMWFNK